MSSQTAVTPAGQEPRLVQGPDFYDILNTEVGNARRLLEAHGHDLRYHKERNEWLVWNGKRWEVDPKGRQVANLMKEVLQEMRNEAASLMQELAREVEESNDEPSEEHQKARYERAKADFKWSCKSESDRCVAGSVRQAASEIAVREVTDADLDRDLMLINLQNGTFDLRTLTLREHRREDLITKIAPVSWDPTAKCPRFDEFLDEIFEQNEELINYVLEVAGYCLTGLTTERIVLFLIGTGANGKSVFCNVMLRGIFGVDRDGYGAEPSFATFTMGKYNEPDRPRNDLYRLRGKRFVSASESDDPGARIDTALIKKLSGDDELSCRANYSQETEYHPQAKVFLRTNNEPRILDDTDSTWDRVKKIVFHRQFTEEERDPRLTEKLVAESSGILNRLVEHWCQVQTAIQAGRPAFAEPAQVRVATEEYRRGQSQVARFFFDTYRVADHECEPIPAVAIYEAYSQWCTQQGEHGRKNLTNFGTQLSRVLAPYKNVTKKPHGHRNVVCWTGIERVGTAVCSPKLSGDELLF